MTNKKLFPNKAVLVIFIPFLLISSCTNDTTSPGPPTPPDTTETPPGNDGKSENNIKTPQVDDAVHAFINKYNIPGLQIAITKDGKLVYRKGYGSAIKGETSVTDSSLFRIASMTKFITSVAIMKLRQEGKLKLSDKVFGKGAILGTEYGTPPYGKWVKKITIDELLHHTEGGGGWDNSSPDPMFYHNDYSKAKLLSFILDHVPLEYAPGTHYAYSNVGYFILGLIIKKITGMFYKTYIQDFILKPIGVTDMRLAGNTRAKRKPNEVVYYQQGGDPYGFNIHRMAAFGGWIATATDYVRFLVHVDGFPNPPDILDARSIQLLTEPSAVKSNYACGIAVNNDHNWWHNGSLSGTAGEFVRTHNGYTWAILMNTRSSDNNDFWKDLDDVGWKPVNDPMTQWPDTNLFKKRNK